MAEPPGANKELYLFVLFAAALVFICLAVVSLFQRHWGDALGTGGFALALGGAFVAEFKTWAPDGRDDGVS